MEKKFEINGVKVVFFTSLENGNNAFSFRAVTSEADANYDLVEAEKPYTMNDIMYRGGYVAYDEYYVSFSDFITFCVKNNVFDNETAAAIMEAWSNFINKAKGTNTEMEEKKMNENAIVKGYITNLGKYNEGDLVYKLISFPIDEDELNEALKSIGCKYVDENGVVHNPLYEEFFFSDWECEIPFDFGEFPNISEINDIAERVELLATYELETLEIILKEHTSDANEALDIVEDCNYTIWNDCINMADVAAAMAEEYGYLNSVPEYLQCYIDYEEWGRDLAIEGTFLEGDGYFIEILK